MSQADPAREAPATTFPPLPATPASSSPSATPPVSEEESRRRLLRNLLGIEVPMVVTLCEMRMPVQDVRTLTTGAVLEFERAYDEPLDLMVGDVKIGCGESITVHEKFGLRIQTIGSVRERLLSIAGARAAGAGVATVTPVGAGAAAAGPAAPDR